MAVINEIKGNIFDSDCQVIVNTVNCDGFMGKGIALEFRYRYPDMFEDYKARCERKEITPGILTLWKESKPWILNFPTKNHWKYPSKMEYIENGLKFFVENYVRWGIKSVAFPRLGSSHGGLIWPDVRRLMHSLLGDLDLTVEIYEFDPTYQDKLFISLINKLRALELREYIDDIGLKQKEAKILKEIVDGKVLNSFMEMQNIPKFGEKSILKLYSFANEKHSAQKHLF